MRAPAKGTAASPLDGGALTRMGSARVGEGAGDGSMLHCVSRFARSPLAAVALRKESGEERGREAANDLGFGVTTSSPRTLGHSLPPFLSQIGRAHV